MEAQHSLRGGSLTSSLAFEFGSERGHIAQGRPDFRARCRTIPALDRQQDMPVLLAGNLFSLGLRTKDELAHHFAAGFYDAFVAIFVNENRTLRTDRQRTTFGRFDWHDSRAARRAWRAAGAAGFSLRLRFN